MKVKERAIAWFLMFGVFLSWIHPLVTQAAQTEPWVLLTKKVNGTEYHYRYDEYGNCVYEEESYNTTNEKTYYTYSANGSLAEEFRYLNDAPNFAYFYDDFGNRTELWNYSKNGDVQVDHCVPEYDEYGRLTHYTITTPYDDKGKLADSYYVESHRYEYYSEPETLFFGHFEQDGNTQNGPEPIEWEILDTDGEQLLLISKYTLDSRTYHSKTTNVSWKDSDLRAWLNKDFLETAFSAFELDQIRRTRQENNAIDWAFLLSLEEVKQYFPEQEERISQASKYTANQGAYVNKKTGGSWWWLRTPGTEKNTAVTINSDGTITYEGDTPNRQKGTVRPAMWVSVTAMKGNEKPSRVHKNGISYYPWEDEGEHMFSSLHTYNDKGQLTSEQWYFSYGIEMYKYAYDDHGNLTEESFLEESFGDSFASTKTYKNSYNYAGHLTKVKIKSDNETEEHVIEYRYNAAGKVISKTTQVSAGKNTEAWEYDRYGNPLRYRWNGIVQEEYTYVPLSQALWE